MSIYSQDDELISRSWKDLQLHYSGSGRYYHNLTHLENLLRELQEVKALIADLNAVLFSLYYHDVIYYVKSKTNEEDSAGFAEKTMRQLRVPAPVISACRQMILATKLHEESDDVDSNYFTDADLSILGAGWEPYKEYTKQIRKEYASYPDNLYLPGRKNVLKHFLGMERIYKTDYFNNKYEARAKENLQKEFDSL